MELATMQDTDSDLLSFEAFFTPNNEEEGEDFWNLASCVGHEDDLLDMTALEPLSPVLKEEPYQEADRQEHANKLGLKVDTNLISNFKGDWLAQYEAAMANRTPTASLPARFALLSTTCVYEPGFTTSPRGKRRISQTQGRPFGLEHEEEVNSEESDEASEDEEPFNLSSDEYNLPLFTDAELSAMVESPSKLSAASTSSAVSSPLYGLETTTPSHFTVPPTTEQEIPEVISMFSSIFAPNFQPGVLLEATSEIPPPAPVSISNSSNASSAAYAAPFDYFSPSGYVAAANQFLDNYGQQVQPFFLNAEKVTSAPLFPYQHNSGTLNNQLVAAMNIANVAAINSMLKMNGSYGVPIAPMDRKPGSQPSKVATLRPLQRAISTSVSSSKVSRLAITPDIADFKLVQIFHQFCDPVNTVLTLPRFQQLLSHHHVKEEPSGCSSKSNTEDGTHANILITSEAQTLFKALDINEVGVLNLECFMHSFQICNRCTEMKRRAHQALCASQGQTFTPTALERQLMEDVAPVVVRVVPTSFEGHKVKSCDHYQWTWCEGFEKTGNEKCRGTNRHDKCPKYLANCTLWKHKLPPKSRKPKLQLENVDSPTKKLKHFS
ncbi:hypothetical protein Plhal304r1_c019g0069731 [Plasmopara halstedii]